VRFAEAIARDESDLVIDLSGVTFMDASIVGLLMRTRTHLGEASRQLTLESPSPRALRVLNACRLIGPQAFWIVGGESPTDVSAA